MLGGLTVAIQDQESLLKKSASSKTNSWYAYVAAVELNAQIAGGLDSFTSLERPPSSGKFQPPRRVGATPSSLE